jgi:DNA-binding transcriptional LysR family regulator
MTSPSLEAGQRRPRNPPRINIAAMPTIPSNASENLTALKLFVGAAQTGSFARAVREIGLSQPTASRIIAAFDKELRVGLFVRTTRAVSLTQAGSEYLAWIEPILEALNEVNHAIVRCEACPKGLSPP